jgi:hypothetical protein
MMEPRLLTVPPARPEPAAKRLTITGTPLGELEVYTSFPYERPETQLLPHLHAYGEVHLYQVAYRFDFVLTPAVDLEHLAIVSQDLRRRDSAGYPTSAAARTFHQLVEETALELKGWLAAKEVWLWEERTLDIEGRCHVLEAAANKQADALEETLSELDELKAELARMQGQIALEPAGPRERLSALAAR